MKKLLVTGGSGFIGTNVIEKFQDNFEILNIDIASPKIESHKKYWKKIDIVDFVSFAEIVASFNPDFVIHLAARTDLNGETIEEYAANTVGVKNLLQILDNCKSLQRVIFTSSMYVTIPGYQPKSFEDYKPHTAYGESKVQTEKIIKKYNPSYSWCITRPTSIWGAWFGEPYSHFFDIVLSHKYLHMGSRACNKTYGYIENTVHQIFLLINASAEQINNKVFYLGDWPAYNISEWADEIAYEANIKIPSVPFFIFKLLAWGGDFLKLVHIKFPMTSFRLKNMTTDNVHDLTPIKKIMPNLVADRKTGVKKTLEWINSQKK
jgi:nucleoside-diphosphate-sugar epimerase